MMKNPLLSPIARIQGRLKKLMKLSLYRLDHLLKSLLAKLRTITHRRGKAVVVPYVSFFHNGQLRLLGRVMEEGSQRLFSQGYGRITHLARVIGLFLNFDLSHARIQATYAGQSFEFESDNYGFFNKLIPIESEILENEVEFRVLDSGNHRVLPTQAVFVGEVKHNASSYFVVSDIDDTILKSHATSIYRLVFNTLFYPFEKRESFLNTVEFYQRLHAGKKGSAKHPFFYVSSSSWNIYPLLRAFIENSGFPSGVMFLQNVGSENEPTLTSDHEHKLHRIREIADQMDPMPFILIGDAGQRDPYLYLQALREYGSRIKAIYIRKLPWLSPFAQHEELVEESKKLGCEMIFFDDPAKLKLD